MWHPREVSKLVARPCHSWNADLHFALPSCNKRLSDRGIAAIKSQTTPTLLPAGDGERFELIKTIGISEARLLGFLHASLLKVQDINRILRKLDEANFCYPRSQSSTTAA